MPGSSKENMQASFTDFCDPKEDPRICNTQGLEFRFAISWGHLLAIPASAADVLFLRRAMSVPGLLHIVSNALFQVSSKLSHFDAFFEQLRKFEGLVTCGRLLRFVNFCVKPSQLWKLRKPTGPSWEEGFMVGFD